MKRLRFARLVLALTLLIMLAAVPAAALTAGAAHTQRVPRHTSERYLADLAKRKATRGAHDDHETAPDRGPHDHDDGRAAHDDHHGGAGRAGHDDDHGEPVTTTTKPVTTTTQIPVTTTTQRATTTTAAAGGDHGPAGGRDEPRGSSGNMEADVLRRVRGLDVEHRQVGDEVVRGR